MTSESPNDQPYSDLRQSQRLADAPALYRQAHERLALELALRPEEVSDVLREHGLTEEEGLALLARPDFAALVAKTAKEVKENGVSFRAKARAIAEDLLPHAYEMATDPQCSSAVRADLIQWAARVGDLEPPKNKQDDTKQGGGLVLSITFAGQAPQQVVAGAVAAREPITIEGG